MKDKKTTQENAHGLQNLFTAYLLQAVHNKRCDYIRRQIKQLQKECLQEEPWSELTVDFPDEFEDALPLEMQLENDRLLFALNALTVRDRDIFLSRVLEETSFSVLAEKYGLSCAGAAAVYYRVVVKLRRQMGDDGVGI